MSGGKRWSDRWFRRGSQNPNPTSTPGPEEATDDVGPWNVLLGDTTPVAAHASASAPATEFAPMPSAVAVAAPPAERHAEPEPAAEPAGEREPEPVAATEPEPEPATEREPVAATERGRHLAIDEPTVTHTMPDVDDLAIIASALDADLIAAREREARADQAAAEAAADLAGPASTPQGDGVDERRAHLREQYVSAWALGDLSAVQLAAGALLDDGEAPAGLLHDLALVAVRRRRWHDALTAANSAVSAATGEGEWARRPSAVLLALAAAAIGDVDASAHALESLGADPDPAIAAGAEPGTDVWVAVRLNPPPRRPGETRLLLDDQDLSAEVVWARAESRLTARVAVVPTPASGHRLGDLVLLAPAASGTATLQGRPVAIIDELDRIDQGELPTLDVTVTCPGPEDSAALVAAFDSAGARAQDWTATVRGLPGGDLRGTALATAGVGAAPGSGAAPGVDGPWRQRRRFGLSAPAPLAREVLAAWIAASPGRAAGTPVEAC